MKKPYLTRLEHWARWMLPRSEAEDVIADYREIVGDPPRPEEELLQDLGKPRKVIRTLIQKKPYYTWLAVFAVLAACILIPARSPLPFGSWPIFNNLFSTHRIPPPGLSWFFYIPGLSWLFVIPEIPWCFLFIAVGLILSLIWFRPRKEEPNPPLSRPILIALAVELALMGVVWWCFYQITLLDGILYQPALIPHWFDAMTGRETLHSDWMMEAMEWGGAAAGVFGVAALVKARTQNRRWRAVYVMSLSLMMLAFCLLSMSGSMDPATPTADPFADTRRLCLTITLLGLAGTGASLC